jgi:hypothetical protein
MSKRLLCIVVVVLTLSSVTWASSFTGGQVNGSFRMGGYSTGSSIQSGATGCPTSGAAGAQSASTQGCTGGGLVLQGQGATGSQYGLCGSQGQCLTAGQGQVVANGGTGSAAGAQFGSAGQTQNHSSCCGTSTQSQYTAGAQIGTTTGTNCGSIGLTGGTGCVGTYQVQTH